MTAYIRRLNAETEQQNAEHAERLNQALEERRGALVPLEQRLRRLLQDIPAPLQREGLSLISLRAQLRGRRRGTAHSGELGAALRNLGFRRERRWRAGEGFNAVWRRD